MFPKKVEDAKTCESHGVQAADTCGKLILSEENRCAEQAQLGLYINIGIVTDSCVSN
jgi:hypothetical protein